MTSLPVDNPETVRRILGQAEALLLDFDGPICDVFAGVPAPVVVAQLCVVLADGGYGEPPPTVEKSPDPFDVLNYAASLGATENAYVNAALTAMESEIIQMATPTQGAHDLIKAWFQTGRPLAIVSNNSTLAIEAYLDLHGLRSFVAFLSGRTEPNPALLKPSPHLIIEAISELGIVAESTVFIGDSSADMLAAQAAGVSFIGYTEKFGKAAKFRELGVTMTTKTMELSV